MIVLFRCHSPIDELKNPFSVDPQFLLDEVSVDCKKKFILDLAVINEISQKMTIEKIKKFHREVIRR